MRVPTFVWLFCDDATTGKGPGCDEGINLRLRDLAVVLLMPTRVNAKQSLQFVKDKSIVYEVITKHEPICKWYIVQILQRLFWTQMSILLRLMKNVTYATPLMPK